jgi:hypothetical protein
LAKNLGIDATSRDEHICWHRSLFKKDLLREWWDDGGLPFARVALDAFCNGVPLRRKLYPGHGSMRG